jgi:hypothetical protein
VAAGHNQKSLTADYADERGWEIKSTLIRVHPHNPWLKKSLSGAEK